MFSKLLKYDFRRVGRFGIPILLILLGTTVLGGLNSLFFLGNIENVESSEGFFSVISMTSSVLMLVFAFFVIAAAASAIQIVIMVDFYRSLVSDVGYLTFTLPVKPRDILLSKLLNSSIWSLIVSLAAFISGAVIISIIAYGTTEPGPPLGILWSADAALTLILSVILIIVYFVNSQMLYFLAIFFSSVITRKNKVLAAVGCVFGVNFIYGMVSNIVSTVLLFATDLFIDSANPLVAVNIMLGIFTVLLSGLTVLFFFLTKHLMENKLNLA